ncbi:hypothetical protein AK812_SmicGene17289 [Symbiodinium microadriaticum]|uniref:Uncharacterized protein n=1 Tax=Symbiodinium microadriaticum TaxID=2951 RepID=A0A1Q9DY19_SYMMI|nr:hypothetical protein AK812_SmicGene17289 [Symbiodinium microadriaticum]CAE7889137.1 unnamed protein product [Symbiodinium microadriaticum]
MEAVLSLGKVPGPGLDVLLPVCRQRFDSSLDVLAYPAFIQELTPPRSAVMLDLTRVGGHYHAACLPTNCSLQNVLEHIARIIWYEESEVEVWVDASDFPAQPGGLALATGSLLTVALRGLGPFHTCSPREVMRSETSWGPLEHAIFPRKPVGEAAIDGYASHYISFSPLSSLSQKESVQRVLRLASHEQIVGTDTHLRLDQHGDHCHTVFTGPVADHPWLLDIRRLGFAPVVCFGSEVPTASDVSKHIPGGLPHDLEVVCKCITPPEKRSIYLPIVQVSIVPMESLRGLSLGTPSLRAAVATTNALGETEHLPEPLQRIGDTPLLLVGNGEGEDPADTDNDAETEVWRPTFVVYALDTIPAHYQIELTAPCSVERALQELAGAIPIERYRYYPRLLAVEPQPSQFWGTVVAMPPWTHNEPLVLLNLVALDGRCYVAPLASPFTRAQVLTAAKLEPDHNCDVFAFNHFVPMDREQTYVVIEAGMITLKPPAGPFVVQGPSLRNMLMSLYGWDPDPVLPAPAPAERACIVLDTMTHVLELEGGRDNLQAMVSLHFGCANSPTHFAQGYPEVTDLQCQGFACACVCAFMPADATTAQLSEQPCLVILDCRPLLQGFALWVSHTPRLPHSDITDWAEAFAPEGWQAQVEGADIDAGDLLVHNGCVLILEFVSVTSSESEARAEESEENGEEADTSDASSSHTSDPNDHPTSRNPGTEARSRSRSPCQPPRRGRDQIDTQDLIRHKVTGDCVLHGYRQDKAGLESIHVGSLLSALHLWQLLLPVFGQCLVLGTGLGLLHWLIQHRIRTCQLFPDAAASQGRGDARLSNLLEVTQRMQFPWLFEENEGEPDVTGPEADGTYEDHLEERAPIEITFAVLVPDYVAEYVKVTLQLPVTNLEAVAILASARSTWQHLRFPHVVPVHPQVRPGLAVCIATPRWHPHAVVVCVDAGELDGRVYAEYGPHYADRDHLLWLADLPLNSNCDVLVGDDEEPLLPGVLVHLVAGVLIQYLPSDVVSRPRAPLHWHIEHGADLGNPSLPSPALQADAPRDWTVRLSVHHGRTGVAQDGSVWTVDYSPVEALEPSAPDEAVTAPPAATDDVSQRTDQEESHDDDSSVPPDAASGVDQVSPWTTAMANICIPYTVAAVDYAPEHGAISVTFPVSLSDVTDSVAQVRPRPAHDRFPVLVPVDPQPDQEQAYFVACPGWGIQGNCIFFDTRAVDGRMFVVNLPAYTDRQGLLRTAQLEGTPFLQVFFREMPWPLQDERRIFLSPGDLVCICPLDYDRVAPATLEERLLDPSSWPAQEPEHHALSRLMWVMTEDSFQMVPTTALRGSNMRRAIASSLGLDPLTLRVSTAVPGVSDFSFRGWNTESVVVAVSNNDRTWGPPPADCTYIIDKRALLLGITWGTAWGGIVNLQTHFDSLEGWCPMGFVMNIKGGRALPWFALQSRVGLLLFLTHGDNPQTMTQKEAQEGGTGGFFGDEDADLFTLLEEAVAQPTSEAMMLASTLLEVLIEHSTPSSAAGGSQWDTFAPHRCTISLADSIPLTSHQSSVLALANLVPAAAPADEPDWLDNDISFLLSDCKVPHAKQQQFRDVCIWVPGESTLSPDHLLVYSDGSTGCATDSEGICAPGCWAFSVWVTVGEELSLLGQASGSTRPPADAYYIGETDDSPLTCELLGVAWSLIWIIEFAPRFGLPVCQHYDCTAAGHGTFATARVASSAPSSPNRLAYFATHLRQLASQRVSLSHAHVKGHAGQVCNELCDELAKHRRRHAQQLDQVLLPTWPAKVFQHPQCDWLWLTGTACQDLPTLFAFESEAIRMQAYPRLPVGDPALGFVPEPHSGDPVPLQFALMSFNVLTLYDPKCAGKPQKGSGMKVTAKRDVIKKQLQEHQVLLLGLQETRLANTEALPDKDYVMLHAPAEDNGHHGVALWASKRIPYAKVQSQPLTLGKEHCCVTGFSSRHLVVQLTAPFLSWTILVAHAPSEPPAPPGASHEFWARCKQDLARRPKGSDVIVLADANAWLGSLISPSVSDLDMEPENVSGEQFHHLLSDLDLWVPSTYRQCHQGPSGTWTAPTGHEHRLDYVAVPLGWPPDAVASSVLVDFESLQVSQDHKPVLLRVGLLAKASAGQRRKGVFRRQALRPEPDAFSPVYVEALAQLPACPQLSWDAHVDGRYTALVEAWTQAGQALRKDADAKPQQEYIQPATMSMVYARRGLREFIRMENAELKRRRLLLGFAAFLHQCRGTTFSTDAVSTYSGWITSTHRRIASALRMVRCVGFHLRQAIRTDRAVYLEGLVHSITLADVKDPKHLFRAVRKAFPSAASKRRQAFTPLPAVMDEQGILAPDVPSQRDLWRAHFAGLEAGEKLEPGQYAAAFQDQRCANPEQQTCFDLSIVPTLTSVEQSILSLKRGKACGQDGLTAELLRNSTSLSARALLPVFVKSILGAQEPIEYRGGALMPLAKKASSAFACAKFRAILLSCVPSKMLHKHVRTCLSAHLSPCALQAGVLPGVSTESIALAARAFQSLCHCSSQPWALLFFDVRSAFYRVIRQLLLPVGDSDKALLRLFDRLHLPPSSVEELRAHLASLATVSQTSCSAHLQKVATDVLQGTWFRLDQDAVLTLTHCGTRPGDGLADMFFAFAFSAYLKAANQALLDQKLDTRMPEPRQADPWPLPSLPTTVGAGSWADDFIHLHAQRQPSGLGRVIQQIVSVYVTQAEAIGMELTFAVDKTAAMVAPKDRLRDETWPGGQDSAGHFLSVRGQLSGNEYRLPLVHAYCHLGGVVTETLTPAPEIGLRHSLAANTVRSLGRKLFGSRHVPLNTRRCLLRSLVMSKFVFGSAVVRFGSAVHFRNWAKHYVALWRALHPWISTNKQPHAYRVLLTAEAPSPPLALALARSVLLRQIVTGGPSTLVRLLWVQWEQDSAGSWFGAVVNDVRHAAHYIPAAQLLLSAPCTLRALLEAVRDDGMWWTRQLKKAAKIFHADLITWASKVDTVTTADTSGEEPGVPEEASFRCSLCSAVFPLRKHLAVHEARRHGLISVTRLLSPGPTCLACMRHYDSTERAQCHLKSSHACLYRVARLIPPLSLDEVRLAEQDCKRLKRQVVHGKWELYKAPEQVQVAAGPKLLTAHERVELEGEDIPLQTLARLFHPCPDFLRRIDTYIADRSQEAVELVQKELAARVQKAISAPEEIA